jgi:arginyl-tRNA synthetase
LYHEIEARFRKALANFIRKHYKIELEIPSERPPRISMGELASPVCFDLAKRLKRPPRLLAQEIANKLDPIDGIERIEVAGAGYLNAFIDRAAFFINALNPPARAEKQPSKPDSKPAPDRKLVVEHTNINPNKAAHIGHLRNAALGDTFVRMLRYSGAKVEVQNYIDNTGVQVADVVLGFLHIEKKSLADVIALTGAPKFDYYCWDLYARVTSFLEADKSRLELRGEILKAIEAGRGETAEIATLVSDAIVRLHLYTMERLGVSYDVLPRESEILHLKFWDAAFALLKERGAIHLSNSGKTAGCWVMRMTIVHEADVAKDATEDASTATTADAAQAAANDDAKIIVRSNGTVTYVGKDIAYQLWKFGLLGRDFHYQPFHKTSDGTTVWTTTAGRTDPNAPEFGHAYRVYNVIDARQSYLQNVVVAGLRALDFDEQAHRSIHFSYEIVALTPRCARELGYELSAEDAARSYVEVSGRRGLGVKADDLLDKLEAAARAEVDQRHAEVPDAERAAIAHSIAIGALRYFMLRFARNTIIAFDFEDALSFEGETGPYCQYAVVRIRGIWRKDMERHSAHLVGYVGPPEGDESLRRTLAAPGGDDLWELILLAGSLGARVEAALKAQEPSFVAKYCFELAQAFNNFYHKHHILSEEDAQRKTFLLLLCRFVEQQLLAGLNLLGIEAPEMM